ncbi:hypothetical protein BLA60_08320 [Actinophytocola xinjiangensis]|uniref:Uncharacterized protein n=1 Tax=Actinophytocola xinjiangensis TaxID=485602 RepID=A0A7Z1AZI4_9PSEU|nr:hypothetical protein [Actinophytocola xinjiangensis]OLF12025.1 hypothetical protein BLA60_08320 [Actinophytocola xinjiangensis]
MTHYPGPQPTVPMTYPPTPGPPTPRPAIGHPPSAYRPLPPPPRRASRRTALALGVSAVALLLIAGLFTALYVMASGEHDDTAATLADRRAELSGVTEQLTNADRLVDAGTGRNADLDDTRTELAACVEAVRSLLWDDLDDAGQDAALDEMFALCQ